MPINIKLFADFNNADSYGRIRLTTKGTPEDLEKHNITLKPGLGIILNDNDSLETSGVVEYSEEEKIWVAKVDWDKI